MNNALLKKIENEFHIDEYDLVVSELESITLEHVMANSQTNLDNTWFAILKLSKGDLNQLGKLVDAAKVDFRDVIYWASEGE